MFISTYASCAVDASGAPWIASSAASLMALEEMCIRDSRCTHQAFFLFTFKNSVNNLLYFIHFEFPLVSPFIYMHQTGFHAPADYHSTDFRKKPLSLC